MNELISQIKELDQLESLDKLYDYVDDLIKSNDFKKIDILISKIIQNDVPLNSLIGLLTITHSYKDELVNRDTLIEYSKKVAEEKGLNTKQIKNILKGF